MLTLTAAAPRLTRIYSWAKQNERLPRIAAVSAALAALAILASPAWQPAPAHADGGASARSQAQAPAPDQNLAAIQAHAQRILAALSDRSANNWVRYWQARAHCDAATYAPRANTPPVDRALIALTDALCAQLHALLGVNPDAYSPRGENRTVGLLLNEPGAAVGYTLFTGYWNHDVFLLDPLGRVAHVWHAKKRFDHAKLLDNGNLLATVGAAALEFDPRGNIVWQYDTPGLHHDFLKMPNGNVMLLATARKTREEAIAAGANPEIVQENGIQYDYLVEVRPTGASDGKIVWQWSVWDHLVPDFDPTKPNYGAIDEHPELIDINFPIESRYKRHKPWLHDWTHINSLDYNPDLDQIMLSPRYFSELWIIDHSPSAQEARGHTGGNSGMGGDLLYRWGNPNAYGRAAPADQRLFWQHQTHWIPPGLPGAGNILVFNNGNEFSGYKRKYSSVDELALPAQGYRYQRAEDAVFPPDQIAWTYYAADNPADFYAPYASGAHRLANGNTLIADGPAGTIFQATPDGEIVWKYVAPLNRRDHLRQGEPPAWGDNRIYRAYLYPPDHPGLQALDLTPGAYIEDTPDIYDKAYATLAAANAGDFGEPLANSDFHIYLDQAENQDKPRLIYIKRPCADQDAQHKFFLHIIPARATDLPAHRQEHGFDNLDFNNRYLDDEVQASDDWCVALRELPDYPIQRIRTGQHAHDGPLWRADINLNE